MLSITYSPKDVAERWACKPDKILSLIATKQLAAFNAATNLHGGKPRWRIRPEDLESFEQRRSTVQPAAKPIARRNRRTVDASVPKYFS